MPHTVGKLFENHGQYPSTLGTWDEGGAGKPGKNFSSTFEAKSKLMRPSDGLAVVGRNVGIDRATMKNVPPTRSDLTWLSSGNFPGYRKNQKSS